MRKLKGRNERMTLIDRSRNILWSFLISWKRVVRAADLRIRPMFGREIVKSEELKYILQSELLSKRIKQLEQQNKKLTEINNEWPDRINTVTHDLRLPISRSKGLVQLLQMTSLNEEQREIVRYLERVNESGYKLIDELLNVHSAEKDQPVIVNLKHLISTRVETFFKDQAFKKGIRISMAIENHLEIYTEPFALGRILDNLISNALKFSEANSTIFIKVLSVEDTVYISVQDQGPGISEADQKHLFKKFSKLTARPTGGESSTGLGLSIVKRLVEQLQGEISVRSELGKGTEFIIRLDKKISNTTSVEEAARNHFASS